MSGHLSVRKGTACVAAILIAICGLLAHAPRAIAQTQTAVEYYYADWDYYFVTSDPGEIAALDGGAFGGAWKRTGETFSVWSDPSSGALPTCRFFSTSFAPKSSHFYTPYAAECEGLKSNPNWQFEAIAFYLRLPDVDGNCPSGTALLWRLYNNGMGGAPNHRYTADVVTFIQMLTAGWSFEGGGRTSAFACVPQPTPSPAEGLWGAVTDAGALLRGVVLDDGTFYFLYATQSSTDFVQGTSTTVNGKLQEIDAGAITFGVGASEAAVRGTYVPRNFLDGSVSFGLICRSQGKWITCAFVDDTFRAFYSPAYEQPASLSAAAGTYAGVAGSSVIKDTATFALDASGALSGTAADCTFTGIASPRGNVNIFNVSVTFQGGACALGTSTVIGVIYYDAASAEILLLTVNAQRLDGFAVVGSKQ